jgi:predicted nucleic acid-binding protein
MTHPTPCTPTPNDASNVNRFSSEFVLNEDRIRILVERKNGDVLALWLTRRFLNKLIPLLLNKVSTTIAQNAQARAKSKAVQKFMQTSAVSGIKLQESVRQPSPEIKQVYNNHLITSVELMSAKRFITLCFKVKEDEKQKIRFSEVSLRQWLNILYKQYIIGCWTESFWPCWIDEGLRRDQSTRYMN